MYERRCRRYERYVCRYITDIFIISCIHTFRAGRIDQFPYIVDFRSAWWLPYIRFASLQTNKPARVFFSVSRPAWTADNIK